MSERAGLFEDDFDVSGFMPKKPTPEPQAEAVRAVSESASFTSREPIQSKKKTDRRHRTGRNEQLNVKVTAKTLQLFYNITDTQNWVQGETIEKALEALQRELRLEKPRVRE